jgi:hypothetical protein
LKSIFGLPLIPFASPSTAKIHGSKNNYGSWINGTGAWIGGGVGLTLNQKSLKVFETRILPYLNNRQEDEHSFDLSLIQRWILQKVIDLG